jgi:hypothetical protein
MVPYPSAAVILVFEVFADRCECALAASSTEAAIASTVSSGGAMESGTPFCVQLN